jgi:hypothetical protein
MLKLSKLRVKRYSRYRSKSAFQIKTAMLMRLFALEQLGLDKA